MSQVLGTQVYSSSEIRHRTRLHGSTNGRILILLSVLHWQFDIFENTLPPLIVGKLIVSNEQAHPPDNLVNIKLVTQCVLKTCWVLNTNWTTFFAHQQWLLPKLNLNACRFVLDIGVQIKPGSASPKLLSFMNCVLFLHTLHKCCFSRELLNMFSCPCDESLQIPDLTTTTTCQPRPSSHLRRNLLLAGSRTGPCT